VPQEPADEAADSSGEVNIAEEIARLQGKVDRLLKETYSKLTPWQKTLVARHPERPHFSDYVSQLVEDFVPLSGDRSFADDPAIVMKQELLSIPIYGAFCRKSRMIAVDRRGGARAMRAMLEAARHAGVGRFLYAASSSCYGIPDAYPTPETAPARPQYPYALTKLIGEQCVLHWSQLYRLPAISLRLFNVYGPRSRTSGTYGAVFGVFLAQKLKGLPFTVVGDGTQSRDFTFVADVADAFVTAAQSTIAGEAFNVGTGAPVSVNRLVELLKGDAVHVPPGMMHHQHFNPYDRDMKELRFEFGVRYWLVDQWKGYTTVDKHLKATTHMVD